MRWKPCIGGQRSPRPIESRSRTTAEQIFAVCAGRNVEGHRGGQPLAVRHRLAGAPGSHDRSAGSTGSIIQTIGRAIDPMLSRSPRPQRQLDAKNRRLLNSAASSPKSKSTASASAPNPICAKTSSLTVAPVAPLPIDSCPSRNPPGCVSAT